MLYLTGNAAAAVCRITGHPAVAGVRVAAEGSQLALCITPADGPDIGDWILQVDGATVYLDPVAAELTLDLALDAVIDTDGTIEFLLADLRSDRWMW